MNLLTAPARALARALLVRQDGGAPPGVLPPPRQGAADTTPRRALTLDSVYRAVSVIQTAAKQLSIDTWRDGARLEGADVPALVARPGPETSTTDLVAETVASLALRGNAYWRVVTDSDSRPSGVQVLNPLDCVPVLDPRTGRRTVQWHAATWEPRDLRHLRLLRVPGDPEGLGPVQACQRALAGAIDMADYVSRWIDDSGVPSGVLSSDQDISPEQAEEAKRRWNEANGPGKGVAVVGRGLHYAPMMLKPTEINFLESRDFDVRAVGRMFGIPAHMLLTSLTGSSMTYQNVIDSATDFIRWTVMSYLREIEDALTQILPRGTTARFNLDALLRADTRTRMTTHATAITAGVYDAAYARRIEGIPDEAGPSTPRKDQ